MPSSSLPALGGLDLSALAAGAQAETGRRVQGAQSHLAASLASMLNEQGGMLAGQAEAQGRDQTFQRAQAMLAESLARRGQIMEDADRLARARFEAEQAGGQPNWYDQQRFQTDENIRQAKALAELERQQADEDAREKEVRLSDYSDLTIDPQKGFLIDQAPRNSISKGKWSKRLANGTYITDADQKKVRDLIEDHGTEPIALDRELRKYFGGGQLGANRASYALYRLGYGSGLLGGGGGGGQG